MVVGDSLTAGFSGDYTWRYFAWKALLASGEPVDFVGPSTLPANQWLSLSWPAVYARSDFDADHAGTWADSFDFPLHDRRALVGTYRPSVIVLELGINDINTFHRTPKQVVDSVREWVQDVRLIAPDTDFVLVELVQSTSRRVRAYNTMLRAQAPGWSTPSSDVVVAHAAAGFVTSTDKNPDRDTWDPVHPNTKGQVRIAAAVVDGLAALGRGDRYPRPLSVPAEGPRVRPVMSATTTAARTQVTWTVPPGATNYDVWRRVGAGRWRRYVSGWYETSVTAGVVQPCRPVSFKVLARRGFTAAAPDMTSRPVSVATGRRVSGQPRVRATARRGRVVVRWSEVAHACGYRILARLSRRGGEGTRTVQVTGRRHTFAGLAPGTRLSVRINAVGDRNTGPASRPVRVRTPR